MSRLPHLAFALALAATSALPLHAEERAGAFSRVFTHVNGNVTRTQKNGNSNQVIEETYDKNQRLLMVRQYLLDKQQRYINGIIYDGQRNPLGTVYYKYDENTGRQTMELLYNKEAKLIRQLYYPGSLKDPRFARRIVAFTPNDKNEWFEAPGAKPIRPITNDQDAAEFEPSMPSGRGKDEVVRPGSQAALPPISAQAKPEAAPATPAREAPASKPRRSWLPRKQ